MPRERAVITGATGFLGSHLAERLLDDGVEVIGLDNFLTGPPANVAHLAGRDGFRLVRADVTDFIHVVGPVGFVLHFASPASPLDYLQLPIETLKVGSIGTLHAIGLAREKGSRRRPRSTATRRSIRSPRPTGVTSTRLARVASTTRRNGSRRR